MPLGVVPGQPGRLLCVTKLWLGAGRQQPAQGIADPWMVRADLQGRGERVSRLLEAALLEQGHGQIHGVRVVFRLQASGLLQSPDGLLALPFLHQDLSEVVVEAGELRIEADGHLANGRLVKIR